MGSLDLPRRITSGSGPRGRPEAGRGGQAGLTAGAAQRRVTGSNEALNALARMLSAELAGYADGGG